MQSEFEPKAIQKAKLHLEKSLKETREEVEILKESTPDIVEKSSVWTKISVWFGKLF